MKRRTRLAVGLGVVVLTVSGVLASPVARLAARRISGNTDTMRSRKVTRALGSIWVRGRCAGRPSR